MSEVMKKPMSSEQKMAKMVENLNNMPEDLKEGYVQEMRNREQAIRDHFSGKFDKMTPREQYEAELARKKRGKELYEAKGKAGVRPIEAFVDALIKDVLE